MANVARLLTMAAAFLVLSPSASAQVADWSSFDWSGAGRVEVDIANFNFTPETITLRHGEPYVIRFVNKAGGGHNFVAKAFFAAATMPDADRARLHQGGVDLGGAEVVEIRLIAPSPGSYKVKCTHFMHASFGMKGTILVS